MASEARVQVLHNRIGPNVAAEPIDVKEGTFNGTIRGNISDLGGVGAYAIRITSTSKCAGNLNVVYASNTVANATAGLTNIPVTP